MQYRRFGKGNADFIAIARHNGPLTRSILQ